jgi:hypothetical protein
MNFLVSTTQEATQLARTLLLTPETTASSSFRKSAAEVADRFVYMGEFFCWELKVFLPEKKSGSCLPAFVCLEISNIQETNVIFVTYQPTHY